MIHQPKQRSVSDENAMYILNLKYGLGKTYADIERITGISRWVAAKICNGETYQDVYKRYWSGRNGSKGNV
jgi:hypothetical protein